MQYSNAVEFLSGYMLENSQFPSFPKIHGYIASSVGGRCVGDEENVLMSVCDI